MMGLESYVRGSGMHPLLESVKVRVSYSGVQDMATTKKAFETIPVGTSVTWHYRSAIGHGTVIGVHKMGTTADNTMYSIRQHDHHPGEPDILHHSGKALSRVES
jgi:hypothetical protein